MSPGLEGLETPARERADAATPAEGSHPWPNGGPAVFSVDVEDYYQVASFSPVVRRADWAFYPSRVECNVERLLDLLDRFGVKATWFMLGWEAKQRPHMVRWIAERGHEIGCHSFWHREIFRLTPDQFREDTRIAVQAIEDACGRRVLGYRAPSFSIVSRSLWALDVLIELGFVYDSSIFPVLHPNYGISGASPHPHRIVREGGSIWELPPATAPLLGRRIAVAGGGYLRQFPLSFCRWGIEQLTAKELQPAMLYLHPWEIDDKQPRLAADYLTRVRHYRNLGKVESRLSVLLRSFRFATAETVMAQLDPGAVAGTLGVKSSHLPKAYSIAAAAGMADRLTHIESLWMTALQRWGRAWITVTGHSMLPFLRPGDRVLVQRASEDDLRAGEIGVFFNGQRVIVHRVLATWLARGGRWLLEAGDAAPTGTVQEGITVIGRVVAVQHGDETISPLSRPWRLKPVAPVWLARLGYLRLRQKTGRDEQPSAEQDSGLDTPPAG